MVFLAISQSQAFCRFPHFRKLFWMPNEPETNSYIRSVSVCQCLPCATKHQRVLCFCVPVLKITFDAAPFWQDLAAVFNFGIPYFRACRLCRGQMRWHTSIGSYFVVVANQIRAWHTRETDLCFHDVLQPMGFNLEGGAVHWP